MQPVEIKIRKAMPDDFDTLFRLIEDLADYEKLKPPDDEAKKRLRKDIFSDNPILNALIVTVNDQHVGYALYLYSYSSFLARRTLYLEDIYIQPDHRGFGLGKKIMEHLLSIAREEDCGRMEWVVLDWNKTAIDFYERLGAVELKDWITYRLVIDKPNQG